ncbi:hypothetical protein L208DRAFT_1376400 [Tricholoma matsutake]|nr:hypothetical protein L208DRAFT_1376400 [Tricholoma matsutake 945]
MLHPESRKKKTKAPLNIEALPRESIKPITHELVDGMSGDTRSRKEEKKTLERKQRHHSTLMENCKVSGHGELRKIYGENEADGQTEHRWPCTSYIPFIKPQARDPQCHHGYKKSPKKHQQACASVIMGFALTHVSLQISQWMDCAMCPDCWWRNKDTREKPYKGLSTVKSPLFPHGKAISRSTFPVLHPVPIIVVSIRLQGMDHEGNPSFLVYNVIKPFYPSGTCQATFINLVYNIPNDDGGAGLCQYNESIDQAITKFSGRLLWNVPGGKGAVAVQQSLILVFYIKLCPALLEKLLQESVELGAHSGMVVYLRQGGVYEYFWAHPAARPLGVILPLNCSSCGCLDSWAIPKLAIPALPMMAEIPCTKCPNTFSSLIPALCWITAKS